MAEHKCEKQKEWGEQGERNKRYDAHCNESDRPGGFREQFVALGKTVEQTEKMISHLKYWLIVAAFIGGFIGGLTGRISPSLVDWIRKIAFAQASAEEVPDAVPLPAGTVDNAPRVGLVPCRAEKGAGA